LRERVRVRLAEQQGLVRALLRERAQLQGSLVKRFGRCGKPSCACRTGPGHGPYYVLSTRSAGTGGFDYLDARGVTQVRELLGRKRRFQARLRRLRVLNGELVRLLRRYQQSLAGQGARRLRRPAKRQESKN
jgi:hypothetical protein